MALLTKPLSMRQTLGIKDTADKTWRRYCPYTPTDKQAEFLSLGHREALFGGAAGGGKSVNLLMAALQYVDYPGYAALLLRRTFADLSLPGALMHMAEQWLTGTDAKWKDQRKSWVFPSGASMTFGYLDTPRDKYRYQSSQYNFVGWDELTQFPEDDYRYLFSRVRRLKTSTIPIRVWSASNPGNIGHEWVKQRFMVEEDPNRIFVPSLLDDNPHLDREEYEKTLMELDPITRQQLLHGDWTARHSGNKFKREWFEIVDAAPAEARRVRYWDLASTEPKQGTDPDWTAGLKMATNGTGVLYIEDVRRMRGTPGAVEQLVRQTAEIDGIATSIYMEREPGSSGVNTIDNYRRRVLQGFAFYGIPSTGKKEIRANPVASQAEAGNIKLVRGPWINAFLDEMELFPQGSHDDSVDAASGAYQQLAGKAEKKVYFV